MKRQWTKPDACVCVRALSAALLLLLASPAWAQTDVDVQITSDNAYGFGWGDGAGMFNYFGGIENLTAGQIFNCNGGPETYTVQGADTNDFLYVVTWSDGAVSQGLLARFQIAGFTPIYSGMGSWQVYATGVNYSNGSGGPSMTVINEQIVLASAGTGPVGSSASWVGRTARSADSGRIVFGENNVTEQGSNNCLDAFPVTCQNVMGPGARWMWYNRDSTNSLCAFRDGNHREFLIFRLSVSELTSSTGCTHSEDYWRRHNANAPAPNNFAWPVSENNEICGQTYLNILNSPTAGSAWMTLAHRWVAAEINRVSGISVPLPTSQRLDEAILLLTACNLDPAQQVAALQLADDLHDYNSGVVGPGACTEEEEPTPSPPTPTPTATPTAGPETTAAATTTPTTPAQERPGCNCAAHGGGNLGATTPVFGIVLIAGLLRLRRAGPQFKRR